LIEENTNFSKDNWRDTAVVNIAVSRASFMTLLSIVCLDRRQLGVNLLDNEKNHTVRYDMPMLNMHSETDS